MIRSFARIVSGLDCVAMFVGDCKVACYDFLLFLWFWWWLCFVCLVVVVVAHFVAGRGLGGDYPDIVMLVVYWWLV